jgi:ADP-ribosyl-[dinitrogen reductase] hydrolase
VSPSELERTSDRLAGVLLGTALGDALGLPAEGMSARAIARRFGRMDRFRLLGQTGFVSDDTEQAALVAECLARHPDDPATCAAALRQALVLWFACLPWGIGRATVRACVRIALGRTPTGVRSAGNGAAMRAAVVGAFFDRDAAARAAFGRALAEVTHLDPRAVDGALFVGELAAAAVGSDPDVDRGQLVESSLQCARGTELTAATLTAVELARAGVPLEEAARKLGTTGYVVHSVAFAAHCFVRYGDTPLAALQEAISAGGDTDSIGAILGGWLGALHGEAGLPTDLLGRIHDGPFGPTHLRAVAKALAGSRAGARPAIPSYSRAAAFARNLALWPVILAHGFRRLLPL